MGRAHRAAIIIAGSIIASIAITIITFVLLYEEPPKYEAPCRGPGHIELPKEKCE